MKLKDLTKAELEAMSYDDIAELILKETNRQMKINELFKEVCNLLELSENEFMDKLPAFFDVLSTDQRFLMLENGLWDLKTKHSVKVVVDNEDEEDDVEEDLDLEDLEEEQEEEEDIFTDDNDDDDLTDDDDDLKDLVIIDEDEEQMV
ncbi:MAG: DNA-directed RNA polymerase subunit delta [Bacilli bacterium]|nr:DNA-directed RNA polymerase subunit delta [Bacillota bacterium]MBR6821196.1 DNA-directed RNA polymerase subunit delta [Bacilli bacterium]